MKKLLFFVPLVLAVLAGCEKEVVEDDPIRMDPDHLTYVEEGVRLIAGAEQSRVSFELQPGVDEGTYVASKMAWEVGDIIKVWYKGRIRRFVTNTAGAQGNFNPCTPEDVITRGEFDGSQTLIAYYNVTSIAEETGNASFTIAANQTEGDATNKIPLYAYLENAALVYDEVHIQFKPMASVVDFSVSAAARTKNGSGDEVLSYTHEGFTYKLKKVVLEPKTGASGWTVGECSFVPSTGAVSSVSTTLSAITFNFADTTNIAVEGGRHFQMIVGQCRLNESGAEMRWYKKGDDPNYVKSIWASKDIDLTDSRPKYLFQGINPKAVGLYDYDDYKTKFYYNRAVQDANYINICDDERNVILTGDIDMGDGVMYFNRTLSWGFDGRNHCFKNFNVTDYNIPAFFNSIQADMKNLKFGDGVNQAVFNITDQSNNTHYGPILVSSTGNLKNIISNVNYTLTVTDASNSRFLGGVVGNIQNADISGSTFNGSISIVTNASTHSNVLHTGGIAGRMIASPKTTSTGMTNCSTSSSAMISITANTSGHLYCGGLTAALQSKVTVSGCCNAATVICRNYPPTSSNKIAVGGLVGTTAGDAGVIIKNSINLGDITSVGNSNQTTSEIGGIICELNAGNTLDNCGNGGTLSATGANTNNLANWYANWCVNGTVISGKVLLGCTMNGVAITTSNYADRYLWAQTSVMGTLSYVTTVAELKAILNE